MARHPDLGPRGHVTRSRSGEAEAVAAMTLERAAMTLLGLVLVLGPGLGLRPGSGPGPASGAGHKAAAYWGLGGARPSQPTCVDIPRNMSLCHGIGYLKMRLPNLLEHDTMGEVSQQASSWLPLLNVRCHADTQLFLCSLFSPVCLDRAIYPCRSLCDEVRGGCEARMNAYGFPWPDMFRCDRFPVDNDMCIAPQSVPDGGCLICNQVETYENILDNFCRADFAVRTKVKRFYKTKLACKKAKVLKAPLEIKRQLQRPVLIMQPPDSCCESKTRNPRDTFLIMGMVKEKKLVPSFIMTWGKRSKPLKKAVRMFRKFNCSDPKLLTSIGDSFINSTAVATTPKRKTTKGKRFT